MTEVNELSEDLVVELEGYITDIDTIMQDPDYVEAAVMAITKIEAKIQDVVPLVNEGTPAKLLNRIQICATTLSQLAQKADEQLEIVKQEALKLRKAKKVSDAYKG